MLKIVQHNKYNCALQAPTTEEQAANTSGGKHALRWPSQLTRSPTHHPRRGCGAGLCCRSGFASPAWGQHGYRLEPRSTHSSVLTETRQWTGSMTGLCLRRGREHAIWFLYGLCLAGDDLKARVLHPCPLCSREDRRLTIQVVMRRHIFFLLEMARERSDQDLKDREISEGTWTPSPKRPVALLAACHRRSLVGLHYP